MQSRSGEYPPVFWFHLLIVFAGYLSPFLFSWRFILLAAAAFYVQILTVGDCILNRWQFGSARGPVSFTAHYLGRLGIRINQETAQIVTIYIMPPVLVSLAAFWQIILGRSALLPLF
jgi:hypothetical protein